MGSNENALQIKNHNKRKENESFYPIVNSLDQHFQMNGIG